MNIHGLISDYKGYIMGYLHKIINSIIDFLSTIYCKTKMRLWGINYGKGLRFRGNTAFYRSSGTIITIGDSCTFNSCDRFNFRGINHRNIIQTSSMVEKGEGVRIGNRCGFSGVSIVCSVGVTIGDDVSCGTNVMIGDRNDHENRWPGFEPKPVFIGNNVWIGMNSIIMRGVTIGDNTIIGAGSIVTKDIPSNTIAAGSPCRVIRQK